MVLVRPRRYNTSAGAGSALPVCLSFRADIEGTGRDGMGWDGSASIHKQGENQDLEQRNVPADF